MKTLGAAIHAAFVLTATMAGAHAAAPRAEFAVRWDPRHGGPATPQEALRGLRLKSREHSRFEVQYFDFTPPAALPNGFTPILRKRLAEGRSELSFKLRGSEPLPGTPSLKAWDCPLGATQDRKDEVDLSFVGDGRVVTAHSRSCDLNSRAPDLQPPASLQARLRGCPSSVTRLRSGKLKVEQWRMADGSVLLEASRPGRHDAASRQAFEREVLTPLLALRVQPLQRSKSAIGADCTG